MVKLGQDWFCQIKEINFTRLILSVLAISFSLSAIAERADKFEKATISYDGVMTYDTVKEVSHFNGNVVITKGSLVISSDYLTTVQAADGYSIYTVTSLKGNVAKFRQKQDSLNDKWISGEGESITYREKDDFLTIDNNAKVRISENGNLSEEASGAKITYDARSEQFVVKSNSDISGAAKVRATFTIMPKNDPLIKK